MSTSKKTIDIVTSSVKLKKMLRKRLFDELKLSYRMIIEEAEEIGIKGFNKANLSKYFGSDSPQGGAISQRLLLYLTTRYGIIVRINIHAKDYNEELFIKEVKVLFKL